MSRSFLACAAATALVMLAMTSSASAQNRFGRNGAGAAPSTAGVGGALSGGDIQARFVGNTIDGVENGQSYSEYLVPDGTLRGVEPSGPYTGRWRIANNQICFHYDEEDGDPGAWDCSPVTLVGQNVYWSQGVDEDPPEATVVSGNPKNL